MLRTLLAALCLLCLSAPPALAAATEQERFEKKLSRFAQPAGALDLAKPRGLCVCQDEVAVKGVAILFFIAVGASINFRLLSDSPGTILSLVLAVVVLKAAVLIPAGRLFRLSFDQNSIFAAEVNRIFRGVPETDFTFQLTFPNSGFGGMVSRPFWCSA